MFLPFTDWLWTKVVLLERWVRSQAVAFAAFLGPEVTAVQGRINWAEAGRILTLALSSGSFAAAVQVLLANLTSLFIDSSVTTGVSLGVTVGVAVLDFARRLHHGKPPIRPAV